MTKKMLAIITATMVVSIPWAAIAHGSVNGSFTGPRWEDHNSISMGTTVSTQDQHNEIKNWLALQRKVGSSWKLVETWRVDRSNSTGFNVSVTFEPCAGSTTGSGTFRTKWEAEFFNDAGERVHHMGPFTSAARTISNTTCSDDGV